MNYFEQQPLLLILIIILTVEGWTAVKKLLAKSLPWFRRIGIKS